MKILGIETSCDETAVSIVEAQGDFNTPVFTVLGNALYSQVKLHAEFGGVYPNLAKREHARNLVPLLEKTLTEAEVYFIGGKEFSEAQKTTLEELFSHEPELLKQFLVQIPKLATPDIDAIAVTHGPGLEPALWVGINFANALGLIWGKPVIPINHMEGHIFSAMLQEKSEARNPKLEIGATQFPILVLLISGGHTELVLMKNWFEYELIGETLDDAVGEAFDKVGRMLSLPYPGGPEISKLAEKSRMSGEKPAYPLPRPMLKSDTCDFSFAGLKTAVLYTLKKIPELSENKKEHIAHEFENAVTEVLVVKTKKALEKTSARTLVLGGGVSANIHIRRSFKKLVEREFPGVALLIPEEKLTTDNAVMIAVAGYFRALQGISAGAELRARGELRLA